MAKILVLEDDLSVLQLIRFTLEAERFLVDHCATVAEGLVAIRTNEYDLLVLDWALPDGTGIDLCKQYRAIGGHRPILMLTARESSRDKVAGLTAGADDYVVKPFDPDELVARIKALLRRPPVIADAVIRAAGLELDTADFTLKIGERSLQLLPKEFAILQLLMEHPDRYFSAESILARVWRSEASVSTDTVRTHLKTLRKKLSEATNGDSIIQNSRGLGYIIRNCR